MEDISLFFQLGWGHIMSLEALDHLLFLQALMALYAYRQWKQVLILITAFTIGHSLTLALSLSNIIHFNARWVEFLIPFTIVLTSIYNIIKKEPGDQKFELNYLMALIFGLIHGMGFASAIRFMMADEGSLAVPLLSFNVGIEVAQIVVVLSLIFRDYLLLRLLKIKQNYWTILLSVITGIGALIMCLQRRPF